MVPRREAIEERLKELEIMAELGKYRLINPSAIRSRRKKRFGLDYHSPAGWRIARDHA